MSLDEDEKEKNLTTVAETSEEQRKFWNGPASEPWIDYQEERDASIAPLGALAMERLHLQAGRRVLDVGCGCGTTSLELADLVGPDGSVLGVDVSAPMLARAEERRRQAGVAQLSFLCADAGSETLPDAPFDAVYSRFGVMFFADPLAAFANIRAAMAAQAMLSFVCWRPLDLNPWVTVPRSVVLKHVAPPAPPAPNAPGQFSFADSGRIETILSSADFSDIEIAPFDQPFVITTSRDPDVAVDAVLNRGPARRLLSDADDAVVENVRAEMAPVLEAYITDQGLTLGSAVWVVTARSG